MIYINKQVKLNCNKFNIQSLVNNFKEELNLI